MFGHSSTETKGIAMAVVNFLTAMGLFVGQPPAFQVRLGYMFRSSALGYFAKETVVILGPNK